MHEFHGDLVVWIQNWFTLRRQRAVMEECYFGQRSVTSEVLQESVLGRLLFVIYTKQLGHKG